MPANSYGAREPPKEEVLTLDGVKQTVAFSTLRPTKASAEELAADNVDSELSEDETITVFYQFPAKLSSQADMKLHLASRLDRSKLACNLRKRPVSELIPVGVDAPRKAVCQRCLYCRPDLPSDAVFD